MLNFRQINKRDYLVLLGLLCQSLSNSLLLLPLLAIGAWYAALRFRRTDRPWKDDQETLALLIALILGYGLASRMHIIWFAGLGNALVLYQFARLYAPAPKRETAYFPLAVAITQIAISAQVVFGFIFLLILAMALVLVPAALTELELMRIGIDKPAPLPGRSQIFTLFVLTLFFFFFFPRQRILSTSTRFGRSGGRLRPDLDMRESGVRLNDRMIFRIEGKDIGYLRCFTLDKFNGARWLASPQSQQPARLPRVAGGVVALHRVVKIMRPGVLDTYLPFDGTPAGLPRIPRQRLWFSRGGALQLPTPLRRPVSYEYSSYPIPSPASLSPGQRQRCLEMPPVSSAVQQWMKQTGGTSGAPSIRAQRIMQALRTTYTYTLGAPRLSNTMPLDDFLLHQKKGHCERFASAMAASLRILGIPSRVVIGFLPIERNTFGGFYNIRSRHAHAWAEGWLKNKGWVQFDATPMGEHIPQEQRRLFQTVSEWLNYLWYAKIVEYGFGEQRQLSLHLATLARQSLSMIYGALPRLVMLLGFLFGGGLFFRYLLRLIRRRRESGTIAENKKQIQRCLTFYRRLLHLLEHETRPRHPSQTPLEYLWQLEKIAHPGIKDIRLITQTFCAIRYGGSLPTLEMEQQIAAALERLEHQRHSKHDHENSPGEK